MEIANAAAAIMLLSCAGDEIGEKGQFCPGIISVTTGTKARRIAADNDASAVGGPTFVQFFRNTIVLYPKMIIAAKQIEVWCFSNTLTVTFCVLIVVRYKRLEKI